MASSLSLNSSISSFLSHPNSLNFISKRPILLPNFRSKKPNFLPFFRSEKPIFLPNFRSQKPNFPPLNKVSPIKSLQNDHSQPSAQKPNWENVLSTAASLFPVYVTVGGIVACVKPTAFSWFVQRGPFSYSFSLGFIMLVMGLTLEFRELLNLFMQRPFSILFGCVAQYSIMPGFAAIISKFLGLNPSLSVGLILLGCCPGGTASNVVTLIARGDVPLSIVMTVCTTLGAVFLTPFLTKLFAGTYVPIDAIKLSLSTLQVVIAPILLGSYLQSTFPASVKLIIPFAPLLAVLASSLLASSPKHLIRGIGDYCIVGSVVAFCGFFRGIMTSASIASGNKNETLDWECFLMFAREYLAAAICGFKESQRRAISIEVGMQNSSLGVVLATSHFTSPLVSWPAAMSAVLMNIMGSSLGFLWRYIDPADSGKDLITDPTR